MYFNSQPGGDYLPWITLLLEQSEYEGKYTNDQARNIFVRLAITGYFLLPRVTPVLVNKCYLKDTREDYNLTSSIEDLRVFVIRNLNHLSKLQCYGDQMFNFDKRFDDCFHGVNKYLDQIINDNNIIGNSCVLLADLPKDLADKTAGANSIMEFKLIFANNQNIAATMLGALQFNGWREPKVWNEFQRDRYPEPQDVPAEVSGDSPKQPMFDQPATWDSSMNKPDQYVCGEQVQYCLELGSKKTWIPAEIQNIYQSIMNQEDRLYKIKTSIPSLGMHPELSILVKPESLLKANIKPEQ